MLDTADATQHDAAKAPATVDTPLGPVPVSARACPACGADNGDAAAGEFSRPPWLIKTCAACGFVYLDPVPRYEALTQTLSWERSREAENQRRAGERPRTYRLSQTFRKRNRIFGRRMIGAAVERHAPPGNVVDIGCAEGGQAMLLGPDYVPFGVEISAGLAEIADRTFATRGGRCVLAPAVEGLRTFPEEFFTAAMLRSYLEHEVQPREVLAELARTLKPAGVAIVKVPNFGSLNRRLTGRKWCGFRYPDHVNYFTPASLRAMGQAQGFSVGFGLTGAIPTSDNMWAVLRRQPAAGAE
jgi:SAM-dependent methyltransferase